MLGRKIAHYTIREKLGAGGMGEVYRAEDTKLGRDVALKILPPAFAEDSERMARFGREAQLLASLNHPNIGAIYGIEESDPSSGSGPGTRCLVLELIEGEDLSEKIARGPVPLEEALEIGRQIAEALEAAHDGGVIHRDLKPGNIKMTPEGTVKVLDFGLAKAFEDDPASSDLSMSPTLTTPATQHGMILGTAAYMSPEQAKGKPADRRADVWAFGVVLHEMLTGGRLFAGETVSETLAAVLMKSPDLADLPGDTPAPIRRLIERCLEKEPKQRLQAIGEARIRIDAYRADPEGAEAAAATADVVATAPATRGRLPWVVAGVLTVALAAALVALWSTRGTPDAPSMRLRVEVSALEPLGFSTGAVAALSPDGRMLAYVAGEGPEQRLYRRPLEQMQGTPLSGTEGARAPFFSPNGKWIGFFTGTTLKKVSIAGGAPLTLVATQDNRGGTWAPDGTIVFAPDITTGLARIPHTGGTPEPITERNEGERSHRWPSFLPDGKHVLFIAQDEGGEYDDATIEAVNIETRERTIVHEGGTYPRYVPTGHLVYVRDGTLFAAPFDPDRLEVTGTPAPLLEQILFSPGATTGDGTAQYAFSKSGSLIYLTGDSSVESFPIVWADRKGESSPLLDEHRPYLTPRLSPDGERLALQISSDSGSHIWIYEIERGAMSRLTFAAASENYLPVWSPDGTRVAYGATLGGETGIYWKRADGAGEAERLTHTGGAQSPGGFSPEGHIVFHHQNADTSWDIEVLPFRDGSYGEPEVFLATSAIDVYPDFSPDGRWISYSSNESGQFEVYVRPYPGPGGKWQISTGGGGVARWTKGGRELIYRQGNRWFAVPIEARGDSLSVSRPELLFEALFMDLAPFSDYDITADGERFVVFPGGAEAGDSRYTHLNLILNWFDEVRRLAPAAGS